MPLGQQDDATRDHDAGRYRSVGRHVQECATDIDVAFAARSEQPGGNAVNENADGGNDHYRLARNRFDVANRWIASHAIAPTAVSRNIALKRAARMG